MVILGIDPGTTNVGYGIVRKEGDQCVSITYGMLNVGTRQPSPERLVDLHAALTALIEEHKPEIAVTEKLLFSANRQTAMQVSQAIGVILFCIGSAGLPWQEYAPNQVKQAVTGYGAADKRQVQLMVQRLLKLEQIPKPDHAADALAVCICHAHSVKLASLGYR